MEEVSSLEVNALAGKILTMLADDTAVSEDVLIGALKVAAAVIEETRTANYNAKIRSELYLQMMKGRR